MAREWWTREVLPGFVVFEGLDGAGTTTQAKRLAEYLNGEVCAEFTCEPTDFATGRVIRALLKGPEHAQPETLALLFAADRTEHLTRPESGIRARLAAGSIVVCDRYLFSSLAYQGAYADAEFVAGLNSPFPLPEHLFFIDTPLDEAYRRMENRIDRDSLEQRDVQERIAPRYRTIIEEFSATAVVRDGSARVHWIDGSKTAAEVFRLIVEAYLY